MTDDTRHELTAEEMFDTLNGFEEIAIAKHFGAVVTKISQEDQLTLGRALIFAAQRRKGDDDKTAKQFAMQLTIKETTGYFAEEPDEADPEEPVTEAGKDDSSPASAPETSLSSVSLPAVHATST